jgi:hypothetical protein
VKKAADWPRYMKARCLAGGRIAYYWIPQERDVKAGCPVAAEKLGTVFETAAQRARFLNKHLDDWRDGRSVPAEKRAEERIGTVQWWFAEYYASEAFTRNSSRTQEDYRELLTAIGDLTTALTDEAGNPGRTKDLPVNSLTPAAIDKIYARLRKGGSVTRQADYAIDVARRAWKVVSRVHPGLFLIPMPTDDGTIKPMKINPWEGVLRVRYERDTAIPATRAEALKFAAAAAKAEHPALGVAALICYEWHQRPEDVRGGRITWTDYRPADRPNKVRIFHHTTGRKVWKLLETTVRGGKLYPELEAAIAALPRLGGVPMVMFRPLRGPKGEDGLRVPRLYSEPYAQHLVQSIRAKAGLPDHFTLEACRHGGMTELGDAELTEQEVMTLSTHATPQASRIYVKRTERQEESAAVKRRNFVEKANGRKR